MPGELLQRIHQTRDCTIQVFVRAAQLFDFVDRVQNSGVMLAAELPANFGQRSGGELLDDVHGHLARESDGAGVAADLEVLFAKIEMLADAFLD